MYQLGSSSGRYAEASSEYEGNLFECLCAAILELVTDCFYASDRINKS